MGIFDGGDVFGAIGATPAINAAGAGTVFGGSNPSPQVMQAMLDANRSYVDMAELMEKSGEYVAGLVGAEAAYITSGCAAALTLSVAACMAGDDPEKIERLPKTDGMPYKLLVQRAHRHYGFERMLTIPGAELVEIGAGETWTPDELDSAIDADTAAVFYLFPPNWDKPLGPLGETVEVAHGRDVPVIVDAAATIYPVDHCRSVAQAADLVCFGGKYFQAPHATGFVCGTKDMVRSVAANGFAPTGPISTIGRPMKMDRQAIVACVAAVDNWFTTNHEERMERCDRMLGHIRDGLEGVPGVRTEMFDEKLFTGPRLVVHVDSALAGKDAHQVHAALEKGEPKIFTGSPGHRGGVLMDANTLADGEERIVANRLLEVLNR